MSLATKQQKKIGPYQIGENIGNGAMGSVYKGLTETGKTVAIKSISLHNKKEETLKGIQKEIDFLKKLHHLNIVDYIDFIATDTSYNIILEYVEGGSLANYINKFGPFSEKLVAIFIKQVLQGLEYLHKQGIVHRDIKGANILTTKNGVIKLTDFGVATKLTEGEKTFSNQNFIGTPYWMAPEAIEMRGHISTSCDIWSVGCTIIELLTGNPPYYDLLQYPALFRMVEDDHPPLPEGISEQCEHFLMECFQKDPALRIDATNLLKHSWISVQSEEVSQIINSPDIQLPEEVAITVKRHLDETGSKEKLEDSSKQIPQSQSPKIDETKRNISKMSQNQEVSDSYRFFIDNSVSMSNKFQGGGGGEYYSQQESILEKKLFEEGSFLSVDMHNQEHLHHQQAGNFDSLKQLNFTRKSIQEKEQNSIRQQSNSELSIRNNIGNSAQKQQEYILYKNIQKIMTQLQDEEIDLKQQELQIKKLQALIQQFSGTQQFIVKKYGLNDFFSLIQRNFENSATFYENEQPDLEQQINKINTSLLAIINQLIEKNPECQMLVCLNGSIPNMLKYASSQYVRDVRIEAAYFIGQLAYNSRDTFQMLIAAGATSCIIEFLEPDYENNKDLVCYCIDCLNLILENQLLPKKAIFGIFAENCIIYRLILTIAKLYKDTDEEMKKKDSLGISLKILAFLSNSHDNRLKKQLLENEVISNLLIFLQDFQHKPYELIQILTIIKNLSLDSKSLSHFEQFGLIPIILKLLFPLSEQDTAQPHVIPLFQDLLTILLHLANLNTSMQEQIANQNNSCQLLFNLASKHPILRKTTIPLLSYFVTASNFTRQKLKQIGGINVFLEFLDDEYFRTKILDTLVNWLELDREYVEQTLISESIQEQLVNCLKQTSQQEFQQIIPSFQQLIMNSEMVTFNLSQCHLFLSELVQRLAVDYMSNQINNNAPNITNNSSINNNNIVGVSILEILNQVCQKHREPIKLLNDYKIQPILIEILKYSQRERIIIMESLSNQLLLYYSQQQ